MAKVPGGDITLLPPLHGSGTPGQARLGCLMARSTLKFDIEIGRIAAV